MATIFGKVFENRAEYLAEIPCVSHGLEVIKGFVFSLLIKILMLNQLAIFNGSLPKSNHLQIFIPCIHISNFRRIF